ncbi:helix-turn-helix domain-containing protein [Kutzneria sp. 744]|uniref:helix-turn-helix domain-containing protein n=1 Tax=Kutzneria sp. (strain 744) TaxID=345341 RepID=UPI0003EEB37E|nr:helix-turn-helix domain-containing protein [Kutzneria sp. 744]EWM19828.1 hypothetical protein KUTG_10132 [Kutzneria sp. 744]
MTQLDLAEAIAANPAYVDRVLARLREDGLVITGRCLFHIPAPEELARAAREPTPPKT